MKKSPILIVDTDRRMLETYSQSLDQDFLVHCAVSVKEAWEALYQYPITVIVSDQKIPKITGVNFLKQVKAKYPKIVRIIIATFEDSQDLISGVNEAGIYQFLCKPWHPDNLKSVMHNAVKIYNLQNKHQLLPLDFEAELPKPKDHQQVKKTRFKKATTGNEYAFDRLVRAPDSVINVLCEKVKKFATYDVPVLIYGESGTGKELFARAIHYYSARNSKSLVIENCAALPDDLLESELFGHVKGAFTGAYNNKKGLLEAASKGTVFLDEIGDISPAFQVKLLRALQEKMIRPLGSNRYIPIDIRVIAATNKNLKEEIKAGRFREDLFYRLAGVEFLVPPLRERKGDIELICMSILQQANELFDKQVETIDDDVLKILIKYPWGGNVRELENEIQKAVIMTNNTCISINNLSDKLRGE